MISRAESMKQVNRQKKVARFVARMDETIAATGADPESKEAAAVAVEQLEKATYPEWRSLAVRFSENDPSEWTRLGIANVYRVRAGLPLLTEPWVLPEPPCRKCGEGKPRFVFHNGHKADVCVDCHEAELREDVELLSPLLDPATRNQFYAEDKP